MANRIVSKVMLEESSKTVDAEDKHLWYLQLKYLDFLDDEKGQVKTSGSGKSNRSLIYINDLRRKKLEADRFGELSAAFCEEKNLSNLLEKRRHRNEGDINVLLIGVTRVWPSRSNWDVFYT